jgi:Rab GDP dissociation inhibitor
MYGLGGLPEGFSRLCAIHGGTFMLNADVKEVMFDDDGAAWGVKVDVDDMQTGKRELQVRRQRHKHNFP